ncbi:TIGR04282 family arsenosugar biosynthesis glycosyltransferase [Daejeonella oryzae]|uniref:TIGR04282 family arsenosugar biosynthesis glycosyltransferase n=1 Tax=Daejeonella oryzae TaxID=1122943 RepID=UPI00040CCAA5|nr:TIGR04282 family arsenosugar biosynthesis glycosyltransferase [Daejeonella oryzae]
MEALIIFIKNPLEGKVKTRLAVGIGDKNALVIYKYLLDHTQKISSDISAKKYLFYDEIIDFKDNWPETIYEKHVQSGSDLGLRMQNAFNLAFQNGHKQVVIIGSDCIDLDAATITEAFKKLHTRDFVIGPALDGGYYLLGMKSPEHILFENKIWSSSTVAAQTLEDINRLQKTCYILPSLSDIDTIDDLNEELKNLIR